METKGIFMHWLLFKPLRFARGTHKKGCESTLLEPRAVITRMAWHPG